jgi:hypothetical protein
MIRIFYEEGKEREEEERNVPPARNKYLGKNLF